MRVYRFQVEGLWVKLEGLNLGQGSGSNGLGIRASGFLAYG